MATIVVLDPIAEAHTTAAQLRERPATLDGKRLGLLDNTKANASELLRAVEARLHERFNLGAVLHKAKPLAAVGAAEAVLDELAAHCDVAIVAIGD